MPSLPSRSRLCVSALALFSVAACHIGQIPQRDAAEILARPGYAWLHDSTPHTRIHYLAGSPAADSLTRLKRDVEAALATAVQFVGDTTDTRPIDIFAVPTRAMVGDVAGMPIMTNALNFWEKRVIVIWISPGGWPNPHEFVHVLAYDAWGAAKEWWLGEGVAVAGGRWLGRDVDQYAKCLSDAGELIPLTRIIPRLQGSQTDDKLAQVTYPEVGSFVRFLIGSGGREKIAAIYTKGAVAVPFTYGRSLTELEQDWRTHLATVDARTTTCPLRS
jgi:hypothetical protein